MSHNFASLLKEPHELYPIEGRLSENNPTNATGNYWHGPLKTGDSIAGFPLPKSAFLTKGNNNSRKIPENLCGLVQESEKPLVLAYLSLDQKLTDSSIWSSLQADIQVMGGRLLIVTNAGASFFTHKTRTQGRLTIIEDKQQYIAQQLGLFDRRNPLSDWISGTNAEIPLPAFYLLSPALEIRYHHIDYGFKTVSNDFTQRPFVRHLLTAVYQQATENSHYYHPALCGAR